VREDNQVIIAPVTRRELYIPHVLDLVCNYMRCTAYQVSLAFDIVVLQVGIIGSGISAAGAVAAGAAYIN
jgi:hypothetical protein